MICWPAGRGRAGPGAGRRAHPRRKTPARRRPWRYAAGEGDAALAAKSLDLIDALFRTDTPGIGWLRRGGMAWVDRLAPLKRRLALHAYGLGRARAPLAQRLPAPALDAVVEGAARFSAPDVPSMSKLRLIR